MRIRTVLIFAAFAVALAACKHETPIERAERLCIEQENAKAKDASPVGKDLADIGARAVCSAGPALCKADPDSGECKKFIEKYN